MASESHQADFPEPGSGLADFLKSLTADGRALVSARPLGPDSGEALALLVERDQVARQELAMDPPPFSALTALWAARLLYRFCQFTVCRDVSAEQIAAEVRVPVPEPRSPAVDWSADLTLRHLPKLFQLARHFSPADPLVEHLKALAAAWPLSSVGLPGVEPASLESFVSHRALRRLYADRIVAADDRGRLGHPAVDDLLRADVGIHRDLAPGIAERLFAHPAAGAS